MRPNYEVESLDSGISMIELLLVAAGIRCASQMDRVSYEACEKVSVALGTVGFRFYKCVILGHLCRIVDMSELTCTLYEDVW